jgi:hypothetical protein
MDEAEQVLRRAMVASVTGTRPAVSAAQVAHVLHASFNLRPGDFTVHLHHPEDFLIIFATQELKEWLSGDHFIGDTSFSLIVRPWCKLAHAGSARLEHRVELQLSGIPAQAWQVSTVESLLGHGCWVERIHPDTRSRSNMALFQLTARTSDVSAIRPRTVLEIVETVPARTTSEPPSIRTLTYHVSIEITHIEPADYVPGAAAAPTGDNEGTGNGNDAGDADRTGRRGPRR